MISKVLPLLNRLIPSKLATRGLAKKIPQLENFFEASLAAGYGIDSAMDFLRSQYEEGQNDELRPDQQAAAARTNQQGTIGKGIQKLGNIAGAAVGAAAIPSVIGNLFEDEEQREQPPHVPPPDVPQEIQKERNRINALNKFNQKIKSKKPLSEFSREELIAQFQEAQQDKNLQGKAALLQTMQEITEALRRMRGNG